MNEEGKHPWASDKEKRGPMASTLWRRNLPTELRVSAPKNTQNSRLLLPRWQKKASSSLLYSVRRKKGEKLMLK